MKYLLLLFLVGCTQINTVKQERLSLSWESGHPARVEWSDALVAALAQKVPEMSKAKDIKTFCPKFDLLEPIQKNKVFAELMIGMAKFESNYKPETAYRECDKTRCRYSSCFKHPTYGYCMIGNKNYDEGIITSRGLLQMSIHSSMSYGCGLKDSSELHLPEKNLACAVIILDKQIKREGVIAAQRSYWSVIKSSYSGNHIKEISSLVQKNVKECL